MAVPCQAQQQTFVQVNQFYLLYTAPVVPYLSRHGTLMVGLEGVACCLYYSSPDPHGSTPSQSQTGEAYALVATEPAAHTATLTFDRHTLVFRAGSRLVVVDGQTVPMPERAVWMSKFGQMVVPVTALIRGLGLVSSWNAGHHILSITGGPLIEGIPGESYGAFQMQVHGHGSDALVPIAVYQHPPGIGSRKQKNSGLPNIGTLSVKVDSNTHRSVPLLLPPYASAFPYAWFMAQVLYPQTGRTGLFTVFSPGGTPHQALPLEIGSVGAAHVLPTCVIGWCVEGY